MLKAIAVALGACSLAAAAAPVSVYYDHAISAVSFGAAEIHKAYAVRGETLVERGLDGLTATGDSRIVIAGDRGESAKVANALSVAGLKSDKPQSYSIRKRGSTVVVLGADPAGAMYGALDVA